MVYLHSVLLIVKWLVVAVVSVDLALVGYILYRRAARNRYYTLKDAAQTRCAPIVEQSLAGSLPLNHATQQMTTNSRPEREAIKGLVVGSISAENRSRATALLVALGFVETWASMAFGTRRGRALLGSASASLPNGRIGRLNEDRERRNSRWDKVRRLRLFSVSRALAVSSLGCLSEPFAGVFLREALCDPSPNVCRTVIVALGRNHIPGAIGLLLRELRKSVTGESGVPVRSIKAALVRYSLQDLGEISDYLNDPQPRLRFLLVDTVREICRKSNASATGAPELPPELRSWFLQIAVVDASADVRARSAAVIGYLREPAAVLALRRLLQDENEFVRLHAVRAGSDPYYTGLVGDLVQRITDSRWRVREAAVKAVGQIRGSGQQQLETTFLETSDRYASEQIAEELQRSGVAQQLVTELASPNGERRRALSLCSRMVRLGMDSALTEVLADHHSPEVRAQVFEVLRESQSSHFMALLKRIATRPTDPLQAQAQHLLASRTASTATAGA